MKKKILLFFILAFLMPCGVPAQEEARAKVYKKDPELTPTLEEVVLEDLDGSGYLRNPYLNIAIKASSRYDYPAYSNQGNFIYEPKDWDYFNVTPEGLKFDQVSTYYYLTRARKYFEEHFGFTQSMDGVNPEQLGVSMFYDAPAQDAYFRPPMLTCNETGCQIIVNIPKDPQYQWAPNYYRAFSVLMHEYGHYVFQRFRQRSQFQRYEFFSELQAIDEGYAIFWPSSIMDEPRYGRTLCDPQVIPPYLAREVKYDPDITNTIGRFTNMIDAVSASLWSLREHPRIGKANAEKIIYESMALIPHNEAKITDITTACLQAKQSLPREVREILHDQYIVGAFARHNIPLRKSEGLYFITFVEEKNNLPNTMRMGETREVVLKFKNLSPVEVETPGLLPFNPPENPNPGKKEVITSYSWGVQDEVYHGSANPVYPYEEISFVFQITAPQTPGVYACDWAIHINNQIGYISCNDIVVGFLRGDANNDNRVNLADALLVMNHLISGKSLAYPQAADANSDGQINLADAMYLLNYLYANGPAPE